MASKNVKKRNWTGLLYPESAPKNWRQILQETGLKCAISPLHDKDVYEDGEHIGEPKKEHYHWILCYEGPQTYSAVKALTERLRTVVPKPLESVRGMYRYFTHMDNPDKYQYDAHDIQCLNGFDIRDWVELTATEVDKIKGDITDYAIENGITEYADLVLVCRADDAPADWFSVVSRNTVYFVAFLKSRKFGLCGKKCDEMREGGE